MPVQSTVKLGTTYGQGFGKLREERINPPEFCSLVSDAGETWIEAHTSLEVFFCCFFLLSHDTGHCAGPKFHL